MQLLHQKVTDTQGYFHGHGAKIMTNGTLSEQKHNKNLEEHTNKYSTIVLVEET